MYQTAMTYALNISSQNRQYDMKIWRKSQEFPLEQMTYSSVSPLSPWNYIVLYFTK